MVRRRGTYRVTVADKALVCLFCQHDTFSHREVYMDLQSLDHVVTEQLTLQSFTCNKCGDMRMFQELTEIMYTEVVDE